ncbi:MAG: hypothetical protein IKY50_03355 [Alistipes sp.]|nr:hypothetical protein [Alistipes sp.]MBQ5924480.1 hypothetical protein [Alistipes sp.]MBR5819024.1 hypothetical protein [Alistipes sp.]MEE1148190.1 hypothetical protein [Alistipes sp.]
MTHLRGIALIAVTFLISIATLSAAEQESLLITTTHCAQTTEQPEAEICSSTTSLLTSTQTSGSTHSITPLSRTLPRSLRHSEHQHNTSRVVSAIDSTMAASRYGLYNHKILFVSHARHYYLCRLVRLII